MKTSFWTKLLDLIAPRLCVGCGRRLSAEESVLCPACQLHLTPTDFVLSPLDNRMARLFWGHVPLERAAAYFYYEPKTLAGHIVHAMKYHGRSDVAESLGAMMARDFARHDFFSDIDLLVPVPLTRRRQWQRGYNQSHHIALGIHSVTGIPVESRALRRVRFSESQTHLDIDSRRKNVEGVFRLLDAAAVRGRHVLLVDDVVTSGSTTISCARELLRAEGVRVSVLSLGFTR